MGESITEKSRRLLAEGKVDPIGPAQVFRVDGDHGAYSTVVSATVRICTCPHGQNGAEGDCSHITAAVEWVLAAGDHALVTAKLGYETDATPFAEHQAALRARKANDRIEAEAIFERLA